MSMSKPVFLLVTADQCGYCTEFKNNIWPNLKKYLKKIDLVQVHHINFPSPSPIHLAKSGKYHPDLGKFINWYPTMMLFPYSLWSNSNSVLKGDVMNGLFEKDMVKMNPPLKPYIEKNILEWLNSTLKNNPLFGAKPNIVLSNINPGTNDVITTKKKEIFKQSKAKIYIK
jgi:hypothetical protein